MPCSPPKSWFLLKKRNGMGNGLSLAAPTDRPFGARTRPDAALLGGATLSLTGSNSTPFAALLLNGYPILLNTYSIVKGP